MIGTSRARRLYVVKPSPDRHRPSRQSAGKPEPQPDRNVDEPELQSDRSADEIADLDARLVGMSMLLWMTARFMKD